MQRERGGEVLLQRLAAVHSRPTLLLWLKCRANPSPFPQYVHFIFPLCILFSILSFIIMWLFFTITRVPFTVLAVFTLLYVHTVFGRMPRFEPELMRLQPVVQPMKYTHPYTSNEPTNATFFCTSGGINVPNTTNSYKKRQKSNFESNFLILFYF